jgi:ribonuclease HI
VVYRGEDVEERWSVPAGAYCSSFSAELTAMCEAVSWLQRRDEWQTAVLATDSLSLVEALRGEARGRRLEVLQEEMWAIADGGRTLSIAWIPGHCGLHGNEEADQEAREGAGAIQTETVSDASTREALIRKAVRPPPIVHDRTRATYGVGTRERKELDMSREQAVDLARFRSGHHTATRRWQAMVGLVESAACRLCGGGEEESSEHLWVQCPALEALRFRHGLGRSLRELVEDPVRSLAMLSIVLSRLR